MYSIRVMREAVKDITDLPKDYARWVSEHINGLGEHPRPMDAKKLKSEKLYIQRVGIYRILYEIDDKLQVVTVYHVKHRRDAYR